MAHTVAHSLLLTPAPHRRPWPLSRRSRRIGELEQTVAYLLARDERVYTDVDGLSAAVEVLAMPGVRSVRP
jgi:hypothetical protein